MKHSTGKFDLKGREIFLGDLVLRPSYPFFFKGEKYMALKIWKVCRVHECGNDKCTNCDLVYSLGEKFFPWNGKDVVLVSDEVAIQLMNLCATEGMEVFYLEEDKIKLASPCYTECHTMKERFEYLGMADRYEAITKNMKDDLENEILTKRFN